MELGSVGMVVIHRYRKLLCRVAPLMFALMLLIPTVALPSCSSEEHTELSYETSRTRTDVDGVGHYLPNVPIPPTPPVYVILTPREFVNASLPLAAHRTQLGLASRVYALEDVLAVYEGFDAQEEVHMFLRELKARYPSFQWLLILGDSEHLGPRQLWHYAQDRGQPFDNYYYSDVYYAGLGSDWDDNGNHLYGEISTNGNVEADLDWDIYVGRVPASTEKQAQDSVQKILRYERNPPVGAWMARFLNWGSLMEPPNLDSGVYKYQPFKSNAYKVCRKVSDNLPEHIIERALYDYPQLEGGQYNINDGRDTLNRNNMLSELNGGAAMLNFAGQARYDAYALNDYGPPTGYGTEYNWNEPILYSDWSSLTNGDMMPLMYASSCDVAKFFQTGYWEDRSLETFITSPSGGLIGLISSTGTSARGEEQNRSWGNWWLDEQFWKLFFNQSITRPGEALFRLKEAYRDEWFSPTILIKETILGMLYTYLLLGDPYTDIYTDTAKRFMLMAALDADFYTGRHNIRFQVMDRELEPVPYPEVTFYGPYTYLTVKGDSEGWVETELDLGSSSTINITFAKHNMVPTFFKVNVLPEIADMGLDASEVVIAPSRFEAGENVTVSVKARNLGGLTADDVTLSAEVESLEGEPRVQLPQADLGSVPAKGVVEHRWELLGRPGRQIFRFRVSTSSAQIDIKNDAVEVLLDVPGPMLRFEQGSGVVLPSVRSRPLTASSVTYRILNEGEAGCELFIRAFLGDPHENGTPLAPIKDVGRLAPGGWANGSIEFTYPDHTGILYLSLDPLDLLPPTMGDPPLKQLMEVDEAPFMLMSEGVSVLEDPGPTMLPLLEVLEDVDTPWSSISVRINSADNLTASLIGGQDGGHLRFEPFKDWYGTTAVTLRVDDGSGAVDLLLPVNVASVNDPPVFLDAVEGYMEITLLEDVPYRTKLRVSDVENDTVTFSSPGSPFSLNAATGEIEWTPLQKDTGTWDHTVIVDDGHGGRTELTLRMFVVEVNDPPVVGGISDMVLAAGERKVVELSIEDEEGGPFIIVSNSPMVRQKGERSVYVNTSAEHAGTNLVMLTVSDGANSVVLRFNLTVTVEGNGDDNRTKGFDLQLVLAAAGIALIVFSLLLAAFFVLRKSASNEQVLEEKDAADQMYRDDVDVSPDEEEGGGSEE